MTTYAVLLVPVELDIGKEWTDLTDADFIKMDVMAYHRLKEMLETNKDEHIPFRHYRYLKDVQEQLQYP